MAAWNGSARSAELLLSYSARHDLQNNMNHTPLFGACEKGHLNVAKYLLDYNASIFLCDLEKRSPLHWSALGGHADVCDFLIKKGLDQNTRDSYQRSPLHCAAFGGYINCMNLLLEHGATVDLQDKEGLSALHWAAQSGHLDATKLLFQYGGFPNLMEFTAERLTPLDHALLNGREEVAQYLIEQGALSSETIRDIAAACIQAYYRGYKVRKDFLRKKNLLMQHEELMRTRKDRMNRARRNNLTAAPPGADVIADHATVEHAAYDVTGTPRDDVASHDDDDDDDDDGHPDAGHPAAAVAMTTVRSRHDAESVMQQSTSSSSWLSSDDPLPAREEDPSDRDVITWEVTSTKSSARAPSYGDLRSGERPPPDGASAPGDVRCATPPSDERKPEERAKRKRRSRAGGATRRGYDSGSSSSLLSSSRDNDVARRKRDKRKSTSVAVTSSVADEREPATVEFSSSANVSALVDESHENSREIAIGSAAVDVAPPADDLAASGDGLPADADLCRADDASSKAGSGVDASSRHQSESSTGSQSLRASSVSFSSKASSHSAPTWKNSGSKLDMSEYIESLIPVSSSEELQLLRMLQENRKRALVKADRAARVIQHAWKRRRRREAAAVVSPPGAPSSAVTSQNKQPEVATTGVTSRKQTEVTASDVTSHESRSEEEEETPASNRKPPKSFTSDSVTSLSSSQTPRRKKPETEFSGVTSQKIKAPLASKPPAEKVPDPRKQNLTRTKTERREKAAAARKQKRRKVTSLSGSDAMTSSVADDAVTSPATSDLTSSSAVANGVVTSPSAVDDSMTSTVLNGPATLSEPCDMQNSVEVDKNVNKNVDKNLAKNVDINVDINSDKTIDKNVDKNVDKNIDKNVTKNVDKNVNKNVDKNVNKNVDQNVDKNVDNSTPSVANPSDPAAYDSPADKTPQVIRVKVVAANNNVPDDPGTSRDREADVEKSTKDRKPEAAASGGKAEARKTGVGGGMLNGGVRKVDPATPRKPDVKSPRPPEVRKPEVDTKKLNSLTAKYEVRSRKPKISAQNSAAKSEKNKDKSRRGQPKLENGFVSSKVTAGKLEEVAIVKPEVAQSKPEVKGGTDTNKLKVGARKPKKSEPPTNGDAHEYTDRPATRDRFPPRPAFSPLTIPTEASGGASDVSSDDVTLPSLGLGAEYASDLSERVAAFKGRRKPRPKTVCATRLPVPMSASGDDIIMTSPKMDRHQVLTKIYGGKPQLVEPFRTITTPSHQKSAARPRHHRPMTSRTTYRCGDFDMDDVITVMSPALSDSPRDHVTSAKSRSAHGKSASLQPHPMTSRSGSLKPRVTSSRQSISSSSQHLTQQQLHKIYGQLKRSYMYQPRPATSYSYNMSDDVNF